ncbi:RNA polymerase sigma factor [Mucilaginibacter pedocola]|uniref:RNA polymerase subunit sigma-70 n=1 Tax=Mucilaginibacter pedocola TaxID=1792845 RepID=A0A1S9P6L5_9SPHI|nr:sigma-70 family RNA polymerase sigma factor [Mucilaginibacter pedocola]OOQ56603.1 hypothetical protein BC343_19430 [Mucilaginibacter pedocola]
MRTKKIKLPEPILVRALKEKDPIGINALYHMYSASLFGVISRIIDDTQLSEDVLQETFIRIWQAIEQYDAQKGSLFTWMVNIARNMAIDRLRSKTYRKDARTTGLEGCDEFPDRFDLYERLDSRSVKSAAGRLPGKEFSVVELIYFKGYTHQEAAAALQMPLGSVKTVLSRAIRRLREYYQPSMLLAS